MTEALGQMLRSSELKKTAFVSAVFSVATDKMACLDDVEHFRLKS